MRAELLRFAARQGRARIVGLLVGAGAHLEKLAAPRKARLQRLDPPAAAPRSGEVVRRARRGSSSRRETQNREDSRSSGGPASSGSFEGRLAAIAISRFIRNVSGHGSVRYLSNAALVASKHPFQSL